jgi:hypothetical protein
MARMSRLKLAVFLVLGIAAGVAGWAAFTPAKTWWDCENLVRQDVHRRATLSGLYWPGETRVKFWDFGSATSLLFDSGLSFLEVSRKHYLGQELKSSDASHNAAHPYLRIYFAETDSPHCAAFEYLTGTRRPYLLPDLISRGLRPGECVAIEPVSAPRAEYEVTATVTPRGSLDYIRHRLLERHNGSVVAEYLTISTRSPSDKGGAYACRNNSQAYKGFPWTAIDLAAPLAIRPKPETVRVQPPLKFAKLRSELGSQSRVTAEPSPRVYSHAEYHRNAIVNAGTASIVSHTTLQIVHKGRRLLVPLDILDGRRFSHSLLREAAGRLFVVGVSPEGPRIAVLQFSPSGDPLQADFLAVPADVRKRPEEGYFFDLEVDRAGYQLVVHAGPPVGDRGRSKMRASATMKIAFNERLRP